jgi:regulator of protease activity HflC (stomatin/prohibitin superfamily)
MASKSKSAQRPPRASVDETPESASRGISAWSAVMKFIVIVALLAGSVWTFDYATDLLHQQSNEAVLIGFILLLLLAAVWLFAFIKWILPWFRQNPAQVGKVAVVAILLGGTVAGCSRVNPAHVGIEVDYYGKDRGVQTIPIVTGMVWYNPFTKSIFQYPIFVQTAVWTRNPNEGKAANEEISFNSSEGVAFTADISLSYQIDGVKAPEFYVKFRSDDLDKFTHGFLRNVARDAFNEIAENYTMDQIYASKKDEMLAAVRERVNSQTKEFGVNLIQLGYIGAPRPPQPVIDSINNKVKAIQDAIRTENELRQTKAEAQKKVAQAEGEAQANQKLSSSLTPNLIEWRRLELTQKAIDKWNGARPMVEGSGSGLLLNIAVPSQTQPAAAAPEKK